MEVENERERERERDIKRERQRERESVCVCIRVCVCLRARARLCVLVCGCAEKSLYSNFIYSVESFDLCMWCSFNKEVKPQFFPQDFPHPHFHFLKLIT